MGQTRPVTVFRFISAGTCEERIMAYAEKKLELSINVLQDHDREVYTLQCPIIVLGAVPFYWRASYCGFPICDTRDLLLHT
jgi:hypothetical protein